MFGPTVKPKQPVQAERCWAAEVWRVLPSSDTKLPWEVRAGPLSTFPAHRDNPLLLLQGSLKKGRLRQDYDQLRMKKLQGQTSNTFQTYWTLSA